MAATFTSTGTWTTLTTALTPTGAQNVPSIANESYGDFGTPIPEVSDIIQLVANGYGCQFWVAASFLRQQLTSLMNGEVPRAKNVA